MEDVESPPPSKSLTSSSSTVSEKERERDEEQRANMPQISLEDTLTKIIFESDEEEREVKGKFERGAQQRKKRVPSRHKRSGRIADEEIDDDDFCILVAPTTAKVVRLD